MRPPTYRFGPFELDTAARQLTNAGQHVTLNDRYVGVLLHLVTRPGVAVTRDDLVTAGWGDVAVTDNSLEQAISTLRKLLGAGLPSQPIETVTRRGYRFVGEVVRVAGRETDEALEALVAPHRAWVEGRAALERLSRDDVARARAAFEQVLAAAPEEPAAHLGLANACVMQFEATRADLAPDRTSLVQALEHAREACRIDPSVGEAWATLGFVLSRTGADLEALAALKRAVSIEPGNWRHHVRLASVGWGEERLRASKRALALLPGFPLAHWLAATVHVARQAFDEATRELQSGIEAYAPTTEGQPRFAGVALHWLRGLIMLATGDEDAALGSFADEIALESTDHLYARECAAQAWYASAAVHLRRGRRDDAALAFEETLQRTPSHIPARLALASIRGERLDDFASLRDRDREDARRRPVERSIAEAVLLTLAGSRDRAAAVIYDALASAPPGSAGWIVPVEPMLEVSASADTWSRVLALVRIRAA